MYAIRSYYEGTYRNPPPTPKKEAIQEIQNPPMKAHIGLKANFCPKKVNSVLAKLHFSVLMPCSVMSFFSLMLA